MLDSDEDLVVRERGKGMSLSVCRSTDNMEVNSEADVSRD